MVRETNIKADFNKDSVSFLAEQLIYFTFSSFLIDNAHAYQMFRD